MIQVIFAMYIFLRINMYNAKNVYVHSISETYGTGHKKPFAPVGGITVPTENLQ